MKKYFLIVFLLILCTLLAIPLQKALALAPIDQACMNGLVGSEVGAPLAEVRAYQVFAPSHNTLDAASVYLDIRGDSASVTASVINLNNSQLIASASKTISPGINWILFDFTDTAIDEGVYALQVQSSGSVRWIASASKCYNNGGWASGSEQLAFADYGFAIYTYDKTATTQEESTESTNKPAEVTTSTTQDSSTIVHTGDPNATEPAGWSPSERVNDQTADGERFANDKDYRALINQILADYDTHRAKGAFGLGGVLGTIITWPVLIGLGILIIIVVVLMTVFRRKPKS